MPIVQQSVAQDTPIVTSRLPVQHRRVLTTSIDFRIHSVQTPVLRLPVRKRTTCPWLGEPWSLGPASCFSLGTRKHCCLWRRPIESNHHGSKVGRHLTTHDRCADFDSAGGTSILQHLVAYGGRDDELFRAGKMSQRFAYYGADGSTSSCCCERQFLRNVV